MASVNKVIIVGNLGRDPETRYMPSGDAVTNIRIATTEKWRDKGGEQQEHTEWHRISFFGKTAEIEIIACHAMMCSLRATTNGEEHGRNLDFSYPSHFSLPPECTCEHDSSSIDPLHHRNARCL